LVFPPKELVKLAPLYKVAFMKSRLTSKLLFTRLSKYLEDFFSPQMSIHGVLLDIYGVGTLIIGKSGVGKSECALALVRRGHRLVADDIVDMRLEEGHILMGSGPELIRHHMEIRGLGIINIRNIFGIGAVRTRKRIEMVVSLEEWRPGKEYDRLGLDERKVSFLGVSMPELVIPVKPGRDIATLVEIAAMNQRLKRMGTHSARELTERLATTIDANAA
jgi:HPr kinase/phosphorylase